MESNNTEQLVTPGLTDNADLKEEINRKQKEVLALRLQLSNGRNEFYSMQQISEKVQMQINALDGAQTDGFNRQSETIQLCQELKEEQNALKEKIESILIEYDPAEQFLNYCELEFKKLQSIDLQRKEMYIAVRNDLESTGEKLFHELDTEIKAKQELVELVNEKLAYHQQNQYEILSKIAEVEKIFESTNQEKSHFVQLCNEIRSSNEKKEHIVCELETSSLNVIKNLQEEEVKVNEECDREKSEISNLNDKIESLITSKTVYLEENNKLRENFSKNKEDVDAAKSKLVDLEQSLNEIKDWLSHGNSRLGSLLALVAVVNNKTTIRENLKEEASSLEKQLFSIEKEVNEKLSACEQLDKELKEIYEKNRVEETEINDMKTQTEITKSKAQETSKQISILEEDIRNIQQKQASKMNLMATEKQLLESSIQNMKKFLHPMTNKLNEIKFKYTDLLKKSEELEQKVKRKEFVERLRTLEAELLHNDFVHHQLTEKIRQDIADFKLFRSLLKEFEYSCIDLKSRRNRLEAEKSSLSADFEIELKKTEEKLAMETKSYSVNLNQKRKELSHEKSIYSRLAVEYEEIGQLLSTLKESNKFFLHREAKIKSELKWISQSLKISKTPAKRQYKVDCNNWLMESKASSSKCQKISSGEVKPKKTLSAATMGGFYSPPPFEKRSLAPPNTRRQNIFDMSHFSSTDSGCDIKGKPVKDNLLSAHFEDISPIQQTPVLEEDAGKMKEKRSNLFDLSKFSSTDSEELENCSNNVFKVAATSTPVKNDKHGDSDSSFNKSRKSFNKALILSKRMITLGERLSALDRHDESD